jgi:cell division transport system ATP-binding protein
MIRTRHLFKTYPNQISPLWDVTIEILPGEFVYIFGPSGSGKTTLFRILLCEERPTRGEVMINGIEITKKGFNGIHRVRRIMGVVFQDFKLLRDRTVGENIAFVLEVIGHPRREIRGRVTEVLQWVGLLERKDDPIYALSAGEQQRVAIARALVNAPPILLADEPTGNLDALMTLDVMKIFKALNERGATVVFATHHEHLIRRYPFRVISLVETTGDGKARDGERVKA